VVADLVDWRLHDRRTVYEILNRYQDIIDKHRMIGR
jgi:hypothetical protein